MADSVSIQIPFQGFYNTWFSDEFDSIDTREAEHHAANGQYADGDESEQPEHLRLTEEEYINLYFDCMNYGGAFRHVANEYALTFSNYLTSYLGFDPGFTFDEMVSPREYNFTTDRIFVHAPVSTIARLFEMSANDDHNALQKVLEDRHTSRSGFISSYSNDVETWLDKPLEDWDHNELESLLLACMTLADIPTDWEMDVFSVMAESNDFDHARDSAMDWEKFDRKRDDLRAEKLDDWREANPEQDPDASTFHYFSRDPAQMRLPLQPVDKHG